MTPPDGDVAPTREREARGRATSSRPDPDRRYGRPECPEPRCGLPRVGAGRAPAGWVQVHYAPGQGGPVEPDRWYHDEDCARYGLTFAEVVALGGDDE